MDGPRSVTGTIGTLPIRLYDTGNNKPYQHYLIDSVGKRQDVAGTDVRAEVARTDIREWKIDDWSGGFGFPVWTQENAGRYNFGRNVTPEYRDRTVQGLVLGPQRENSQSDGGGDYAWDRSTATNDGYIGHGTDASSTYFTAWIAHDLGQIAPWDRSAETWDDTTPVSAGGGSHPITGIADPGDGYLYCMEDVTADVYKVDPGTSNVLHVDKSATSPSWATNGTPVIGTHRGEVYVLGSGGDLWRVTRSSTNTVTKVVDAFYGPADFIAGGTASTLAYSYRMASYDAGLVWAQPRVTGTDIWTYNVGEDSSSIVAQLPPDTFPWGVFHTGGFTFVGYAQSHRLPDDPNGYIYYFRGGQSGTIGPLVFEPSVPLVNIVGVHQSRYLLITTGAKEDVDANNPYNQLLVYDLREGALHHWSRGTIKQGNVPSGVGAAFVGDKVLVSAQNASVVELVDEFTLSEYSTIASGSAYLDTGRFDFDLPGVEKLLTEIVVVTEPLPANTTVEIQYSLDGGSWQDNSLDITTDGATSTVFDVSSQNDTFYELELRILLNTTSSTATPTVRSVTARAFPAATQEVWELFVDLNPSNYIGSGYTTTQDMIAQLSALKVASSYSFTNPWEVDTKNGETAQTERVVITQLTFPDLGADENQRYARMRLTKATLT